MNGNQGSNTSPVESPAATLERRIYARIDELFGPVNEALDAVNARLDALAAQYEALRSEIGSHTRFLEIQSANFHNFKETVDHVLDSQESRFEQLERRDKQVELQLEGLAADILHQSKRSDALSDEVHQLGQAVKTARAVNVEQTARIGRYGQKIEELTHALEDHVHKVSSEAMLLPADDHYTHVKLAAKLRHASAWAEHDAAIPQDTYEVDGAPATRAEYEAAEDDATHAHTTCHTHRPFSDGGCGAKDEVRDIGWAVRQLRAKFKVRRKNWYGNTFMCCPLGDNIDLWNAISKQWEMQYKTLACELLATDWEIAP